MSLLEWLDFLRKMNQSAGARKGRTAHFLKLFFLSNKNASMLLL